MRAQRVLVVFSFLLAFGISAGPAIESNAPVRLKLRDQFDVAHQVTLQSSNVTLLTIADRNGSGQIPGWVGPVKKRFGSRIRIIGIAELEGIPGAFRGVIRREIRKKQSHPLLLDWSGTARKMVEFTPGVANVYVLSTEGRVLLRLTGKAEPGDVERLIEQIERALASPAPKPSSAVLGY